MAVRCQRSEPVQRFTERVEHAASQGIAHADAQGMSQGGDFASRLNPVGLAQWHK